MDGATSRAGSKAQDPGARAGLRIVVLHNREPAYRTAAAWAERMGHTIELVVTSPGPPARRSWRYRSILAIAPPEQNVLVTTQLRRVALPLIQALAPDLILSFTFPHRLPAELIAIPRIAALNLHPTPLPRYRGPNPMRMIYDGAPTLGATLHYLEREFDTGAILSLAEGPMPEDLTTDAVYRAWEPLLLRALSEGVERAIAGEPGVPQDHALASYSPEFSEAERWLDWRLPAATLIRRAAGLNAAFGTELVVPREASPLGQAKAVIDGRPHRIRYLKPVPGPAGAAPGTVVDRTEGALLVAAADGLVCATGCTVDD
jgi:methionyl-tRNA formyltransferase